MASTWVVVLAGGESRRFGTDKLAADLGGRTLLDATLASVPAELPVVVVGPERPVRRPVRFVREEPAGGGPAAALVAGLSAVLEAGANAVSTLPGDAPAAGSAVPVLLAALDGALRGDDPPHPPLGFHSLALAEPDLVVAHGADGQVFPLQLACTAAGARRILEAAGPDRGVGASVRRLLESLDPPAARVVLAAAALRDVDTRDDLAEIGKNPTA